MGLMTVSRSYFAAQCNSSLSVRISIFCFISFTLDIVFTPFFLTRRVSCHHSLVGLLSLFKLTMTNVFCNSVPHYPFFAVCYKSHPSILNMETISTCFICFISEGKIFEALLFVHVCRLKYVFNWSTCREPTTGGAHVKNSPMTPRGFEPGIFLLLGDDANSCTVVQYPFIYFL